MERAYTLLILVFLIAACSSGPSDSSPDFASPSAAVEEPATATAFPIEDPATPTTVAPTASPTIVPTLAPTPTIPTPTALSQASLPDVDAYTWLTVAGSLQAPVGIADPGDGTGRLFIVEQPGRILVLGAGSLVPAPFLDITDRVGTNGSERGLLGLAFHPRYDDNGYFYVNYTDQQGDTVIARFSASPDDPGLALPASELQLLRISQPYANHNGGAVEFGPDGYLYLGLGDGGSAGDPQDNGQSLATLLGKILRLDVDRGEPYAVPPDNPFSAGGGLPEIWSYGLRNPWRIAFDRVTGDLFIADVGQNSWEEVNFLPAGSPGGSNFGWSYYEASHPYSGSPSPGLNLVPPVAEYGHEQGCSVTGGVVYRGELMPDWQGVYLYGDYCSGRVWGLLRDAEGGWINAALFDGLGRISSFGEDQAGEVYLVDHSGRILKLAPK